MTNKTQSSRNMTPAQARQAFTQATRAMPPAEAKRIVAGAVRTARQAQGQKVRRQQANARFAASWARGSGIER